MYLRLEASVLLIHDLFQAVHLQLVSYLATWLGVNIRTFLLTFHGKQSLDV